MLQSLNAPQREAVINTYGPLLVIAGAGSGKTKVIVSRIAHLCENYPSESIVALTFTNKAAQEMRQRLKLYGLLELQTFIGTFHGYSLFLLKQYGKIININEINLLDEDDQLSIVNNIIKSRDYSTKINAKNVLYQISQLKNELALGIPISQAISTNYQTDYNLENIYRAYEEQKSANKSLDFDDLIIMAVKLFNNTEFRKFYQSKIKHILIDEYQDTNALQHKLVKLMTLADDTKNLAIDSVCAVGDDDQSIYSWRGATVSNMLDFGKDFNNTKLIRIEQNYRSTQQILTIANQLIKHNEYRNEKNLWSAKDAILPVIKFNCMTSHQEASIANLVINSIKNRSANSSIAILYRTHFQSRVIEEALLRAGITYKIIGGIQFYERKEIKDLLAYLKVINNQFDKISFFRILNCPPRKLGAQFETLLNEIWIEEPFSSIKQIGNILLNKNIVTGQRKESFLKLIQIINKFESSDRPSTVLQMLISETEYIAYLKENFEQQEANQKIENIYELVRAAKYAEENCTVNISQFLQEISLMQEKLQEQNNEAETVQLMTIHAAKGLEFDAVIITGLEEGTLPSARSLYKKEAIEEERRLLYVAITRAKNELYLMHCTYRNSYGQTNTMNKSRFIAEMPEQLISCIDCATYSDYEIRNYLQKLTKDKNIVEQPPSSPINTVNQKTIASPTNSNNSWQVNRTVEHSSFGVGVIKGIETRNDNSIIVTVQFKTGFKKIASQFLRVI
jgi:DNA helicase-2/ATP-dependent DNA helicase PcrA